MNTQTNGATAPAKPIPPPALPTEATISDAVFTGPAKHKAVEIQLDAIVEGDNPRKTFDEKKLKELAESLKTKGQQSPVLLRPSMLNDRKGTEPFYQIVYGERRVRAARLAGWTAISAFVRDMTAAEALEEALIENGGRADVDAYEEAEAFRRLHVEHKRSAPEIAAKVSKSLATVYARLKLAELDPKAREAAQKAGIGAETALLAARIVGAERQREAIKEIEERELSYRPAQEFIQRQYMLSLGSAQFDTADEQLVPAAGSCKKCPKRTGNQAELFADIKAKDVCTDPACFRSKQDAFVALRFEEAKKKGVEVLDDKKAKEVLKYSNPGGGFIDVDAQNWNDDKQRSYRESLGKKLPPVVLAKDPATGLVRELVQRDVLQELTKPKEREPSAEDLRHKAEFDRDQKKREAERAKEKVLRAEAVAKAEKVEFGAVALRGIILLISAIDHEATLDMRGWREQEPKDSERSAADIILSKVVKMSPGELRGLLVDVAIDTGSCSGMREDFKEAFDLLCVGLGIGGAAKKPAKTEKVAPPKCCAIGKNGKACTGAGRHKGKKGPVCASHLNAENRTVKPAKKKKG